MFFLDDGAGEALSAHRRKMRANDRYCLDVCCSERIKASGLVQETSRLVSDVRMMAIRQLTAKGPFANVIPSSRCDRLPSDALVACRCPHAAIFRSPICFRAIHFVFSERVTQVRNSATNFVGSLPLFLIPQLSPRASISMDRRRRRRRPRRIHRQRHAGPNGGQGLAGPNRPRGAENVPAGGACVYF